MDETHIRGAWYKKRSSNHSLQHAPGAWYKKCSRKHRPPSRQSLFWRHLVTCAIATVAALSLTPDLVVCFLTTWALGTRFKIWPNTTPCNRFSKLRTGNPHIHTHTHTHTHTLLTKHQISQFLFTSMDNDSHSWFVDPFLTCMGNDSHTWALVQHATKHRLPCARGSTQLTPQSTLLQLWVLLQPLHLSTRSKEKQWSQRELDKARFFSSGSCCSPST